MQKRSPLIKTSGAWGWGF